MGLVSVLMVVDFPVPSVMAHRFSAMVPAVKAMRAASQILGVLPPKPRRVFVMGLAEFRVIFITRL